MATSTIIYLNEDGTPLQWGRFPTTGTHWSKLDDNIAFPDDGTHILAKGLLASGLQARLELGPVSKDLQTLTDIHVQIRGKWVWDGITSGHYIVIHVYDSGSYLGAYMYTMAVASPDTWYSYSVKSITGLSRTRAQAESTYFLLTAIVPSSPPNKYQGVYISEFEVKLTYTPGNFLSDPFVGFTGNNIVTAPSVRTTTMLFPQEAVAGTIGVVPLFEPPTMPTVVGGLDPFYYGNVYDRIWCVPYYMRPQNPELNTDIPFTIWNAYSVPPINTLNTVGGSGQTGLTLDLVTPKNFNALEELEVNLQITDTAPIEIFAEYEFNFDYGQGIFIFETVVAAWIKIIPEQPVIEIWEWLSDVISAWDSTEQRISIRRQPRRRIEYYFLLEDEVERRREYERYYNEISSNTLIIPFYQYTTLITQDSVATATRIYFNPALTDVRDGELVVIYRLETNESFLLRLDIVQPDGATLASPLTMGINTKDIIAPAFEGRLDNQTGLVMTTVSGKLNVKAWITEFRTSFDRPGSVASIVEFDDLMVLDKRYNAREEIPEIFDVHPTILDTFSGIHDQRSSWLHAFVSGIRHFTIPRHRVPIEMDWWRDFCTALNGQREPFLMPTWRRDLTLAVIPNPGDFLIEINEDTYASQFWPHDTYKRLQFCTSCGTIIYRKVEGAVDQPGGTTLLTLATALPIDPEWAEDFDISYLNKVRLATDQIRLRHYARDTQLELAVRTTDQ